ncbi:MAG TPA: 50S ribosomal protein L29 [Candidatus Saccharimonadales bacterium]|jgi:ribosomal protein L29|nr:50S ribosomal protein L29 [Candidatus Saccharimonadales bacterium]
MKMVDVRKISTVDLTVQTTNLREEIAELRRKIHQGEVTNVRLLRQKRKDLARMLTVLSEQLSKEKM